MFYSLITDPEDKNVIATGSVESTVIPLDTRHWSIAQDYQFAIPISLLYSIRMCVLSGVCN